MNIVQYILARCSRYYHFSIEISIKRDIVATIDSRNFHSDNVDRLALFEDKTNDTVTSVHHD